MGLQEYLTDVQSCLVFCSVLALVTGIIFEMLNTKIMEMVRNKPWCSQAMDLQKASFQTFGYPEEDCTFEAMLNGYSFVFVFCGHHFVAGSLMLPVVLMGWDAAGSTWQLCFVVAALSDVALDMFDVLKNFIRTFLYKYIPWSSPCPLGYFINICCLHHPLSMVMVIPMVIYHPDMRSFHLICVALLLAAGICFTTGAYKFTLDVNSRGGLMQYKAIVLLQLVTILLTRGFVWFTQVHITLSGFYSKGEMKFFAAGLGAATLMSLFNVIMILDIIDAAKYWLPRPLRTEDQEREELHHAIVRSTSSNLGLMAQMQDKMAEQQAQMYQRQSQHVKEMMEQQMAHTQMLLDQMQQNQVYRRKQAAKFENYHAENLKLMNELEVARKTMEGIGQDQGRHRQSEGSG